MSDTKTNSDRAIDNRIRLGPVAMDLLLRNTPEGEKPNPKIFDAALKRLIGQAGESTADRDGEAKNAHLNCGDLERLKERLVSKFDGAIDGMGDEFLAKIGELNNTQLNVERAINMLRYMFTVLAAEESDDQRECIHRANRAIDGLITPLKNAPDLRLLQEKSQDVSEDLTQARDPDPMQMNGAERER